MTNVERVERDIAREKMFREAFMNGKEPTDEDRAAWALADAHNQMSLDYARQRIEEAIEGHAQLL